MSATSRTGTTSRPTARRSSHVSIPIGRRRRPPDLAPCVTTLARCVRCSSRRRAGRGYPRTRSLRQEPEAEGTRNRPVRVVRGNRRHCRGARPPLRGLPRLRGRNRPTPGKSGSRRQRPPTPTWSLAAGVSIFTLSRRRGTSLAMIDATYGHLAPDAGQHERPLVDAYDAGAVSDPTSAGGTR